MHSDLKIHVPTHKHIMKKHILSLLSKTMETYVLPILGNCVIATFTFVCGCLGQGLKLFPWWLIFWIKDGY
jgi:hypothetical protein